MSQRNMRVEMAARWAVFELAKLLDLPMLETVEFDVTSTIQPPNPQDIHTLSYHVDPISFWVNVTLEGGQYLPISAIVRDGSQRGRISYFSFLYDYCFEFRRIIRVPNGCGRLWMVIVGD